MRSSPLVLNKPSAAASATAINADGIGHGDVRGAYEKPAHSGVEKPK
jgi:hypothetical protein